MVELKNIHMEYKASVIFGLCALIMSLLTGIIMGIKLNTAVIRSVILMALFAGIGFAVSVIVRKYVPEVYDLLVSFSRQRRGENRAGQQNQGQKTEAGGANASSADIGDSAGNMNPPLPDASFNELEKDMLSHYTSDAGQTSGVNTAAGKLGKHVLRKEKLAKYEPHLMAQAVRTMMSKDQ